MKTNSYIAKPKVTRLRSLLYLALKFFFRKEIGGLNAEDLIRIGMGNILISLLSKKVFGLNKSTDFLVNFTSKVVLPDAIKINGDGKSNSVLVSFVTSGGCYIQAYNGIHFGEGVIFAPGVKIISANHSSENIEEYCDAEPIKIGSNVWLAANVIILPGVSIGNNSIVGAGSVVTKSFPENVIIAGNPASIIRYLNK